MRKSCAACGKTSWNRSVLTPNSWRRWTRHDLGFERYRLVTTVENFPPQRIERNAFRSHGQSYYCTFAYSALASFRMAISGSASFQSVRKS